ncbi:hypothetical protein LTR85_001156 [Meristemomyces frigidus]|nr:hypothetical protein LTR85_001156 [Meristemomyces frigidus]
MRSSPLHSQDARKLSTSTSQRVTIPCQSNGHITLDIHQPTAPPSTTITRPTVLIYLPRGPVLQNLSHEASTISLLRSSLPFPVVQLNYRVSRKHQYPTPIHDVLVGYDWVKQHLLSKRAISRTGRSELVGRVAVCGELVGGGLATMLALTECRIGQPGIVAAAVNNPVLDWTEIDDSDDHHPSFQLPGSAVGDATDLSTPLSQLRKQVFKKPEHFFDPFASPLLFLRSAGRDVPPAPPETPLDDMDILSLIERQDFYRQQQALSAISSQPYGATRDRDAGNAVDGLAKRKTSKRYPSAALGLRLPPCHISSGGASPLSEQASDLTQRLRKSYLRQADAADFGRKVLEDDEIERLDEEEKAERRARDAEIRGKAKITECEGLGLWDNSKEGRSRVLEMAKWLREKLV